MKIGKLHSQSDICGTVVSLGAGSIVQFELFGVIVYVAQVDAVLPLAVIIGLVERPS